MEIILEFSIAHEITWNKAAHVHHRPAFSKTRASESRRPNQVKADIQSELPT